ncbi:diaminopimelate epimerase [Stomatohabitans albus]|uniref:diaminopimelate epimerase n=1 Tax=Stomatohabitans albus TaxID=3110766 RepID=UPI00300CB52C
MAPLHFIKAHGCGNDFVLLPDTDDQLTLTEDLTKAMCDRHVGIGADGVIRIGAPTTETGAVFMDYRNADGSIAEMCGNGVRTVAMWYAQAHPDATTVNVDTRAGMKHVTIHRDETGAFSAATVNMGIPELFSRNHKITMPDGAIIPLTTLSMGNPHAVVVMGRVGADCVLDYPLNRIGPFIEHHPDFPDGTNVEVIASTTSTTVVGRIHERGVGETLASGTGSSAMAVAAIAHGLTERAVTVYLPGGQIHIDWPKDNAPLMMTGPAVSVFSGTW